MIANNEKALDEVETMLLFAIDSSPSIDMRWYPLGKLKIETSAIKKFKFPDRAPNKFFTFDVCDKDRIYTRDYRLLLNHPSEIINDGIETMILNTDNNTMTWTGTFPTRKPNRDFIAIGKADKWYEAHTLTGSANKGWNSYIKGYAAIDKNGKPLIIKALGNFANIPNHMLDDSLVPILQCSIAEDAGRANSFKATVSEHASVIFPIGIDGYKDFFALREAPRNTPTKRLNPILHWVKKHLRQSKDQGSIEVKKYLRGTETVTIGGLTATISPN